MSNTYTAEQYIDDVTSGRQAVCKLTRLAVERHLRDLSRVGSPDFPYHFEPERAKRVIDFKQQLRQAKGEWMGQPLVLQPWQQFKDWVLFGWVRENGFRRFTKSYVEVARKNGKTTDAAATGGYLFLADRPREGGAEIYCVATRKDQAKIVWKDMKLQLEKHPVLRKITKTYKQNSTIVRLDDEAAMCTVWGKDADTQDGFNPHAALCDELHAWPDHSLMEVLESGLGARRQPLIYIITTAGLDINSPCYQEERSLAVQTLEGTLKPAPENFFALIFTLDEGDDFTDERVWIKANPNLDVNVKREYLRERVQTALQMPSKRNDVLTKNFNVWTHVASRAVAPEKWDACGKVPVLESELAGKVCYGGLDLSTILDISAYCLTFEREGAGPWRQLWRFFIPEDGLLERIRRDKVPYDAWIDAGLVIATPGETIDYDFIEAEFLKDAARFQIREVAYDPWKAHEVYKHLTERGFQMIEVQQSYRGMSAGTDAYIKAIHDRLIAHGGNPVMDWMISCLELKSDRQGNVMPMKPERKKTGKRIDGAVAAIMSYDRAIRHGGGVSVYEERGALVI